jgi:hypothetical protein
MYVQFLASQWGFAMGFAASSARLYMLIARKSDLEFQLQMINQSRLQLTNTLDKIYTSANTLDPESPAVQKQNAFIAQVQAQDKRLELIANRINLQHQAVETEIGAVNKVIQQNISTSFKLMG